MMKLFESFRIALRALGANKTRSALTLLGIVIGVASVLTMVAIGAGARVQIEEQIRSLGANVLMVAPGGTDLSGRAATLTEGDAEAIGELASVQAVAPSIRSQVQLIAGSRNWQTTVNGTTPAYFVVREWGVSSGRSFSNAEAEAGDKVAVIGRTVARELFGGPEEALGQRIRLAGLEVEVIGVLSEKGPTGNGRDQDDILFLPMSTAKQRLLGGANRVTLEEVEYILVKVASEVQVEAARRDIPALLRQLHRVPPDRPDGFRVTDPAAAMQAQTASAEVLGWLLGSIASISLLVGGISIMNIMLVSVSERRREIGLRMALGARRRDIRWQFLIEAVCICLVGGVLGLAIGILAAAVVAQLAGWPVFVTVGSMALAIGFAAGVGLFFGYYPAVRASRADPIRCLREE